MAIKTYRAKSPSEALALVKKDIGADAVILHTRTYKTGGVMGIGAKSITEITATNAASAGTSPAPRLRREEQRPAPREQAPQSERAASREREAPGEPRSHAERAEMLRDSLELSPAARSRSGAHGPGGARAAQRQPEPRASSAQTIVLEPEPDPGTHREARQSREARASGDPSARLDALYLDDEQGPREARPREQRPDSRRASTQYTGRTGHERPERVVEPKPERPASTGDGGSQDAMAAELAELKRMMGQVLRTSRSRSAVALPPALEAVSDALEESELDTALADRVIAGVLEELRPEELEDASVVRQVALRRLAGLIPVDGSMARATRPSSGGPLVIALVGPTGVGKTTTVAKLAATYKLRHGASVGLVTSDTYRIAAVDQLRTYANIIGLPIKVTLTPAEMAQAVRSFEDHDVVILDTAGRSQNDSTRIDELRGFLDAARPHHTQLVLSATSSPKVIRRIAKVFGALEPTHAIATKLDESVALGPIVDAVRSLGAPLSFVTTGQEVPDQIETACAERFARRLLTSTGVDA